MRTHTLKKTSCCIEKFKKVEIFLKKKSKNADIKNERGMRLGKPHTCCHSKIAKSIVQIVQKKIDKPCPSESCHPTNRRQVVRRRRRRNWDSWICSSPRSGGFGDEHSESSERGDRGYLSSDGARTEAR